MKSVHTNLWTVWTWANIDRYENVPGETAEDAIRNKAIELGKDPEKALDPGWGGWTAESMDDVVAGRIYGIGLSNHSSWNRDKGIAKMAERFSVAELEYMIAKYDPNKRIHCGGGFEEQRSNYKKNAVMQQAMGAIKLLNEMAALDSEPGQVEMLEALGIE